MLPRILLGSSIASMLLFAVLLAGYLTTASNLAFAQAVDSLADVFTGAGLLWVWKISLRPADHNHHYGHHSAQPIAAMVIATLIGVMAIEVLWNAVEALATGQAARLTWFVAGSLGAKVAIKVVLMMIVLGSPRIKAAPTMQAFIVDARSDILVGVLSLVGFAASLVGDMPSLDAWFAIPAAAWIGYSAFALGRENVELLMGAAPPQTWHETQLRSLHGIPDVRRVGRMRARTFTDGIHVWVEVFVDPTLTIAQAHDIGEAIEAELLQVPEVCEAVVHVDAEPPENEASSACYGPSPSHSGLGPAGADTIERG